MRPRGAATLPLPVAARADMKEAGPLPERTRARGFEVAAAGAPSPEGRVHPAVLLPPGESPKTTRWAPRERVPVR
ncbi:hypothetical protein NDU88_010231 [Pleurodeles waltl]|uniref:Uncharacterized protein n=1 Tax=Pleurodeles waltl TaxID=8319 RepID=A0AAV7S036_PLEWA|nr:hypothetical protein NDU88_010231 [Pleurodeles waltl]